MCILTQYNTKYHVLNQYYILAGNSIQCNYIPHLQHIFYHTLQCIIVYYFSGLIMATLPDIIHSNLKHASLHLYMVILL